GLWFTLYQFDELKEKKKDTEFPALTILAGGPDSANRLQEMLLQLDCQFRAMQQVLKLVLSPANICTPQFFSDFAAKQAGALPGVSTEVWGEERLEKEGMNLLLAVGRGSPRESRLLILDYRGDEQNREHIALVGKGVCFDTGGTNLKASSQMKGMQYDMMGGAIVYGAFYALAGSAVKGNIRAYIPLVENQIGAEAIKTGDVFRSAMGLTVEVNNTDAEGRLILADAIHCAVRQKPSLLVDCATLTGAAVAALGEQCAAFYSSDQRTADLFSAAAGETGEDVWQLPLFRPYARFLESKVADISNISTKSSMGGSLTAALFLEKFAVQEDDDGRAAPWLHLDMACWSGLDKHPSFGKNVRAAGVRLLSLFVRKYWGI
ncbi:MAG: leucyl aminopeptidase family protein, partial [Spirochaetota bacterium]